MTKLTLVDEGYADHIRNGQCINIMREVVASLNGVAEAQAKLAASV